MVRQRKGRLYHPGLRQRGQAAEGRVGKKKFLWVLFPASCTDCSRSSGGWVVGAVAPHQAECGVFFFLLSSPHHYPLLFLQLVVAVVSIMLLKHMDGTGGKHKR